jgi:multidrug resistance efflux pump
VSRQQDAPRTMGGLWRMVDGAEPSAAALLIARQACFEYVPAVQLVGVLIQIDQAQRLSRMSFWGHIITLLGVGADA